MAYLVTTLWPWVVAAILLGMVVGAATGRPRQPGETRRSGLALDLLVWAIAALLAVGVAAAILHWLRGRHGLWLDMALAMTGAYVLGCGIGAVLRRLGSGAAKPDSELAVVSPPVPAVVPVEAMPLPAVPPEAAAAPASPEAPAKVAKPRARKAQGEKPPAAMLPAGLPPDGKPAGKTRAAKRPSKPATAAPGAARAKPRGKPKA
ncbi:hypothetical protein [Phreatobacter stygius]|uniref:Uncharacterized protein n=1 Tax=Phreatobacter stygius TaxID=1940610 RepID=A0A4D7B6N2_9HYPH|nr:hypothetical protein [Phreatobacter stygius]QCI62777.1 hypothetical protein E8M01_00070 [Phreatobacter stygius]QCI68954.1 hypothetical protein E8M01_34825 [Phreatobacter stygius]